LEEEKRAMLIESFADEAMILEAAWRHGLLPQQLLPSRRRMQSPAASSG
jgi:hypothetical protein